MNTRRIKLRISTWMMGYCLAATIVLQPLALTHAQELKQLPPVERIFDAENDGLIHTVQQSEATSAEQHNSTVPTLNEPLLPAIFQQTATTDLQPINLASFEQAIRSGDFSLDFGGYVKVDLIHDFNAIGSTDAFNPQTIFTDGRRGQNTRLHARQTRLNLDFHPDHDYDELQLFVEGDFFGESATFRLRHAYLRAGSLLVGQTWSTFMDESILPKTLDFESPRSILLDRRALFRFTHSVTDCLSVAVALEDPQPSLDLSIAPDGGRVESPAPDLISRFRYETPQWHLQGAGLVRIIGFREESNVRDQEVGWGFNFTGRYHLREFDSVLFQVAFGEGIESYRQGADGGVDANGMIELDPVLSWVVGYEIDWTDRLSSTFVYSSAEGTTAPFRPTDTVEAAEYLSVNLLFEPLPRLSYGIEYLYGSRTDKNSARGEAHRLQFSVRYDLP